MKKKTHYTVYKTTNLINGKIYIGIHCTNNLDDGYFGSGVLIKQSIEKHGKENFKREILFDFDNEKDMMNKEEELVTEEFVKKNKTYNLARGGNNGVCALESRKKLSNSLKGLIKSKKHRKNLSLALMGCKKSKEAVEKMAKSKRGVPMPEQTKRALIKSRLGKKLSEEHRHKISLVHKNKKVSAETRKKLSDSHKGQIPWIKGKKHSLESRRKMSESSKGQVAWNKNKKMSEEQRLKISNTLKTKNRIKKIINILINRAHQLQRGIIYE